MNANDAICQRAGIEPEYVGWYASSDGGVSGWLFTEPPQYGGAVTKEDIEVAIKRMNREHPDGWAANSTIHESIRYPDLSTDTDACMKVLAAMGEGFDSIALEPIASDLWFVRLYTAHVYGGEKSFEGRTPAEAIIAAALAVWNIEEDEG